MSASAGSARPDLRSGRRFSTRRLGVATARFADRWWRAPLVLAAIVFAVSGPAHALGRVDAVFYASLGGVGLGGLGVVLGCLARAPEDEESA